MAGKVPTAPTIASIIAALQVQEALKLLHEMPVAAGTAMVFNGVGNQFYTTRLPVREDCLSHETYPQPTEVALGQGDTVDALLAEGRKLLAGPLSLVLDRELVVAIDCPRCGWRAEVMRPRTRVRQSEAVCPSCHEPGRPELISVVEEDSPLTGRTLASVGIPPYDIVRVEGSSGSAFYLLAGDRGRSKGWGQSR